MTYSITAGNTQNHFIVNPNTGAVLTAAALDREGNYEGTNEMLNTTEVS